MGDTIDINSDTFATLKGYHQDAENTHVANGEPNDADAGWAEADVSTMIARVSELISASIIVNGSGVSGLEKSLTEFASNDDGAADMFYRMSGI